jgi:hypothetical protein
VCETERKKERARVALIIPACFLPAKATTLGFYSREGARSRVACFVFFENNEKKNTKETHKLKNCEFKEPKLLRNEFKMLTIVS